MPIRLTFSKVLEPHTQRPPAPAGPHSHDGLGVLQHTGLWSEGGHGARPVQGAGPPVERAEQSGAGGGSGQPCSLSGTFHPMTALSLWPRGPPWPRRSPESTRCPGSTASGDTGAHLAQPQNKDTPEQALISGRLEPELCRCL